MKHFRATVLEKAKKGRWIESFIFYINPADERLCIVLLGKEIIILSKYRMEDFL